MEIYCAFHKKIKFDYTWENHSRMSAKLVEFTVYLRNGGTYQQIKLFGPSIFLSLLKHNFDLARAKTIWELLHLVEKQIRF